MGWTVQGFKPSTDNTSWNPQGLSRPVMGLLYLLQTTLSAPVRTDVGVHPASYARGTGSFLTVKWPGHGVNHLEVRLKKHAAIPLLFCPCYRLKFKHVLK
jgi:hypothetical protein